MAGLADIPFYGAFIQRNAQNEQAGQAAERNTFANAGALAQLQAQMAARQKAAQAEQQEKAMRAELGALGPNPAPDALAGVAAKYAPAQSILTSQTASADRAAQRDAVEKNAAATRDAATTNAQAQRDQRLHEIELNAAREIARIREHAAQNRITKEEADRREAVMRQGLVRLAAELRPQRNLQITADQEGNQLIVNQDGTTTPLQAPGGGGVKKSVGTDKPMTEFQGKAALYGTRAAQSDKVLKALEGTISTTGMEAKARLGTAGNFLMNPSEQRVKQAQRDFVNAVLRQESGAVISDQEFDNATKQYFPQAGDKPEVVAQKRANRALAINGFARMSGPKGAVDINAVLNEPLLPGVPAISPTPQQASGKIGGYVEIRKTSDGRTLGKKADGTIEEVR